MTHDKNNPPKSERMIQKVVTRTSLDALTTDQDLAYWQGQSYKARIAALEQIRREYHLWRYGAEPRLQRVVTIIQR